MSDTNRPAVKANRTYLCTIDSVLPGQSKTGTDKVTFSFIVSAGEAAYHHRPTRGLRLAHCRRPML